MGMVIIPEDLIETIAADSEDAEFPATNMLTDHCREVWAAANGVTSAQISINTIGAAANGLMLYYLIGDSATITVYDTVSLGGSAIYGPTVVDLLETDDFYTNEVQIPGIWVPYTSPGVPHSAKVEISRTGDEPEIGRAFAGKRFITTKNPNWGLDRSDEDHSIIYDLDNAYEYAYTRNWRRIRSGELDVNAEPPTEYFTLMRIFENLGPTPVPVLMAQNVNPEYEYIMYARFADVRGVQGTYNKSTITFTLKEFL